MNIFNLSFTICMIFGFFIIIFSLIRINKIEKAKPLNYVEESFSEAKNILNQVDTAIDNISFASEEMTKQFEQNKKELMFLYNVIGNNKQQDNYKIDLSTPQFSHITEKKQNLKQNYKSINHPLLPEIKRLLNENYSIPDIAKKLNIGQGQLQLILELGKEN